MATGNRTNNNLQPRDVRGRYAHKTEGIEPRAIKVKKVKGTLGTYEIVERKLSDKTRETLQGLIYFVSLLFVTWSFSKFYYLYIA